VHDASAQTEDEPPKQAAADRHILCGGLKYAAINWVLPSAQFKARAKLYKRTPSSRALLLQFGNVNSIERAGAEDILPNGVGLGCEWVDTTIPQGKTGAAGVIQVRKPVAEESLKPFTSTKRCLWELEVLKEFDRSAN
jgi:hypothetical protein